MDLKRKLGAFLLVLSMIISTQNTAAYAEISASHVYHNHMPNFWAYYDTSKYASAPVGSPIRYTYDGQVIDLKNNPPAGYPYFLPGERLCHMMISWRIIVTMQRQVLI